ncbi:MAG: hypothetical protein KAW52_08015 [candidate division Zixibacteria bacterium]|nr:hypothetical protein [candidate division Zixibacteria bacterium]
MKKFLLFCILTYLLAYLLQLSLLNPENIKSEEARSILLMVMWVPAIVAIFIKKFSKEGFKDVGFGVGILYGVIFFALNENQQDISTTNNLRRELSKS